MCGVYMIKNKVNGKFYIGSSVDIAYRWARHKRQLRNGNHHSIHLQRAWDKYGEENFEFTVIEECSEDITFKREQYYLDLYKPYNNDVGYNISQSAVGTRIFGEMNPNYGRHMSEESKQKLRELRLGTKQTEETKQKIRDWYLTHDNPMKGRCGELAPCYGRTGEKHPMYGITGSDHPSSKKVQCINNGMIFDSATEASRWAKCNHSKLCMCCRGERKSCGQLNGEKLKWKYIEDGEVQWQNT